LPLHIYPTKSDYIYVDRPTIWSIDSLLRILRMPWKDTTEMEKNGQNYCQSLRLKGGFHFADELPRTEEVWDSKVLPCTHNALNSAGSWNTFDYAVEILPVLEELSIDPKDRGYD